MINYTIPCPILTLDFLDRDKQEVRARLVLVVVFGSNFVPLSSFSSRIVAGQGVNGIVDGSCGPDINS